ncbi:hypothetical protein CBS11232_10874 [Aspergillus niger]|nr:hypothetical protein CBS11232_10874 [Aspergillus niger]
MTCQRVIPGFQEEQGNIRNVIELPTQRSGDPEIDSRQRGRGKKYLSWFEEKATDKRRGQPPCDHVMGSV